MATSDYLHRDYTWQEWCDAAEQGVEEAGGQIGSHRNGSAWGGGADTQWKYAEMIEHARTDG